MKLSKRESLGLDFIRALASLAVVIGHGISYFGIFKFLHQPNIPWMQNIAVVVFFILSGFVITYSTKLKSATVGYGFSAFFSDRFSRIFSAYLVAILFVILLDSLSVYINADGYAYKAAFNLATLFHNILMLQDYPLWSLIGIESLNHTSFGSARIFWTISVEWWIYMFFGVLFFSLIKKEKLSFANIGLFLISCFVVAHYLYGSRGGHLTIYWTFGMALMLCYSSYKETIKGFAGNSIILASALLSCVYVQSGVINGYDFKFALLVAVSIVSFVNMCNYIRIDVFDKSIRIIASYSFTLYLVHYSIIDFIVRTCDFQNKYIGFLFSFIMCNAIAFLISRYSEFHLRDKLKKIISQIIIKASSGKAEKA
ncbi:acyltransferase [Erwinia sp. P6884]|uniref:acyltransferase family protein n=1 Tax=Erwinia sp. P6884 TaxID=3141450 RepID=UPI00319A9185